MQKLFKIITLLVATILLSTTLLVGCRAPEGEETDLTKTQLSIAINTGGVGTNWLRAHADRFEADYADYEFEPGTGKKGVQVTITPITLNSDSAATTIGTRDEEIFFIEQCSYYAIVNAGAALDITDIVTEDLTEFGEDVSIEDKMYDSDVAFFGVNEGGDKHYYGIPWYESLPIISYDIDLFEDQNFYFAAEGQNTPDGFVLSPNMPRSAGPDGKTAAEGEAYGYDDGLPATYDEFFKLCDKIKSKYCVPLVFAGANANYINMIAYGLHADYEGYEQMNLNYTLSGYATDLIEFNSQGELIELPDEEIDSSKGYLLQKQAGRYYALEFMNRLVERENGVFKYLPSNVMTYDHTTASGRFLSSRFTQGTDPIAMLTEGTWWYNENTPTFNQMASIPGAGKTERRIGVMPWPKASEDDLGEATYVNNWISEVVINANIADSKLEAAKKFLQYTTTNKSLSEFTKISNMVRPYEYTLTEEDELETAYYGKQLMQIHNSSRVVNPWSTNRVVLNNLAAFQRSGLCQTIYTNSAGGKVQSNNPIASFLLSSNPATPIQYFSGYSEYWSKENWENAYGNYFGVGAL